MRPRVPLSSVLFLLAAANATPAHAGTILPVPPGPIPRLSPDRVQAVCTLVYSNYAGPATGYYAAGAGREVIDDLHLVATGDLCGFGFTYINGSGRPTDIVVTFYANDGPLGSPGTVVGGPFSFPAQPGPGGELSAALPNVITAIGPDIWMGASFSTDTTGLVFTNPPSIGSSADVYYQRPEEGFFTFGGDPVANFRLSVEVDTPTPVRPTTWGTLKTIYRD